MLFSKGFAFLISWWFRVPSLSVFIRVYISAYRSHVKIICNDGCNVTVLCRLVHEHFSEPVLDTFRQIAFANIGSWVHSSKEAKKKNLENGERKY